VLHRVRGRGYPPGRQWWWQPSEGAELQPVGLPDGVLYQLGIFQFDDELVHFAQREHSDGSRWQFEGELVQRIASVLDRP
jgi:hypothetical protein